MLRLRCSTIRDSKNIHAAIQEIPTKNVDLFFINLSSRNHSPDWLRFLLILPVQCLLTSRKCYFIIFFSSVLCVELLQ